MMLIGGSSDARGKWVNEPCNRNNRVVCEKRQVWSAIKVQELLEKVARLQMVLEKTLEKTQAKLEEATKKAEESLNEVAKKAEENLNEVQKKTEENLNEVQKKRKFP